LRETAWHSSSDIVKRGFCAECGSPIAWQRNDSDIFVILIGTLDESSAFEPQVHFWSESKIPWDDIQANLPDVTTSKLSYQVAMGETDGRQYPSAATSVLLGCASAHIALASPSWVNYGPSAVSAKCLLLA